jgi:hypothetical protein
MQSEFRAPHGSFDRKGTNGDAPLRMAAALEYFLHVHPGWS